MADHDIEPIGVEEISPRWGISFTPPSQREIERVRYAIEHHKAQTNDRDTRGGNGVSYILRDDLPAGMIRALDALHGPHSAMTEDELVEFADQKAREMHKAEIRRNPNLRPDLFGS